jgi:hypothetical protein
MMASIRPELTIEECQSQALTCRKLAGQVMTSRHRVMLEHVADTWDRIAADIDDRRHTEG